MSVPDGSEAPEPSLIRPFLNSRVVYDGVAGAPIPARPELRPYLVTSGRVPARHETLAVETQAATTDLGHSRADTLEFEARDIIELCEEPQSLAELAARLDLHLGVIQVLVHNQYTLGHLTLFLPELEAALRLDTIKRVINGLVALA